MLREKLWEKLDINRGVDLFKEIDKYEEVINRFLSGKMHPERFRSYRLNFGTYGVRGHGDGIHMQRIKVPSGFLFSEQIDVIADVIDKYAGSGVGHLTTRQDIQLHYVNLEDIPDLLRMLARVGITTREACGNTVRNVTSSYLSGICPDEKFDVLPYALYMSRYFLRHPLSSTLPRKFKITFSECEGDHGIVRIHDIGAVAQVRDEGGKQIYGFRVYVGGGLGAVPMPSKLFIDFISIYDFYPLTEAIIRIFHKYGEYERRNRNKARLKFFIARIGFEEFKKLVWGEFERVRKYRSVSDDIDRYMREFPKLDDGVDPGISLNKDIKMDDDFNNFVNKFTFKQKQDGYYAIYIKPPKGNLTPSDLRAISNLCEIYGRGYIRITPEQNILIPWVKENSLYEIYEEVKNYGFINDISNSMRDIVTCPGAYSCRLAITHSYNLAEHIGENVSELEGLRIHISGCPNSCGQHHIADIGFYGASLKVGDRYLPHYVLLIGGNPYNQRGRFGSVIMKVPAGNAPAVVKKIVDFWRSERRDGEEFYEFVDRVGIDKFRRLLAPYSKVDVDDPNAYKEPGMDVDFKMETEARGECVGSSIDLIAINLFDAQRNIYEAEDYIRGGDADKVSELSLEAILKCAKMLVYIARMDMFGNSVEPKDEDEALSEFESRVLKKRWLCGNYSGIREKYFGWKNKLSDDVMEIYDYAKRLVRDCEDAFLRLQPDMRIWICRSSDGDE